MQDDTVRVLRNLRRYQSMKLDAKIRYSLRLIEAALELSNRPMVAWSGGKDSTVLLHLIRENFLPDIDVVFNDTKVEFPETLKFVRKMSDAWSLNLHIAKPEPHKDFWWCVEEYGWPLFGKRGSDSIVSHRRGNKPLLSDKLVRVANTEVSISKRCCYYLKEKPSRDVERALESDCKFLGTMAEESQRRRFNWADYGDLYWHKNDRLWKVLPLSIWLEPDIWEYHERYNIPMCELYQMGHNRNGCWPCTMDIHFRDNHLAALRQSHPKLWRFLVIDKGLGKELVKVKLALDSGQYDMFAQQWSIEKLIEQRPCFFDKL